MSDYGTKNINSYSSSAKNTNIWAGEVKNVITTTIDYLLQEIGDYLLLESGGKIKLTDGVTNEFYSVKDSSTYTNSSKNINSYSYTGKN
jgi:hypothetical protein